MTTPKRVPPSRLALPCALALFVAALGGGALTAEPAGDPVAGAAIPVRSIDIRDRDLDDLAPLVGLVGDARVVALGESSHGAGSDFAAKARIIRFLHERMGFDVILWEAGIYDVHRLDRALSAGADPARAAAEGLYSHWAGSEEVERFLAYVQGERRAGRDLEIAGFDLQISRPFRTTPHLIDDLLELFEADGASYLDPGTVRRLEEIRRRALASADHAAAAASEEEASNRFAPVQKDLAALSATLLGALDQARPRLLRRHSPRHIAFVRRMLLSLQGLDEIDEPLPGDPERPLPDFVRRWNHREIVNTANVAWFAHHRYADRKIVIWAHNAHVVHLFASPDWSSWTTRAPDGLAIRPSGSLLRKALGEELFTVAFTAHRGAVRRVNDALTLDSEIVEVAPSPEGSIEARLLGTGLDHALLPLGRATGELAEWLSSPRTGRFDTEFMPPMELRWDEVADALFFSAEVAPSTLEPGGPER